MNYKFDIEQLFTKINLSNDICLELTCITGPECYNIGTSIFN